MTRRPNHTIYYIQLEDGHVPEMHRTSVLS